MKIDWGEYYGTEGPDMLDAIERECFEGLPADMDEELVKKLHKRQQPIDPDPDNAIPW